MLLAYSTPDIPWHQESPGAPRSCRECRTQPPPRPQPARGYPRSGSRSSSEWILSPSGSGYHWEHLQKYYSPSRGQSSIRPYLGLWKSQSFESSRIWRRVVFRLQDCWMCCWWWSGSCGHDRISCRPPSWCRSESHSWWEGGELFAVFTVWPRSVGQSVLKTGFFSQSSSDLCRIYCFL